MNKKEQAAAKAERNRKNAAAVAALSPQKRMALNAVTGLLLLGGIAFLMFMFRGCGSTTTATSNSTVGMTPAQLLATGDGRERNDPQMATAFARLDAACPENGEKVADIATNIKNLIKSETGQDLPMIFVMNQLSDTQEAIQSKMTCVDTGIALVTIMSESR
ncbi:hypothetical protein [Deinococcus sp. QL22]|uniref:hypothetical protein n=1 Tax=Deinococcus sp. QL22 TaxID=2939437 RepID=UPI0020178E68|nr:hypothetical protein [Deinococcus sp. QL22]UQN10363.1 hypothetical protein M1R55_29875 [Deinococcus sp. QL22]UQN10497.1 hypothetical protein M1R55_29200 [Deinococcus sp. QL22]